MSLRSFFAVLGMNVSETKPLMQYAFAYPDIIANLGYLNMSYMQL
jgi:hypothetical protein